jgi:hypothetical protein
MIKNKNYNSMFFFDKGIEAMSSLETSVEDIDKWVKESGVREDNSWLYRLSFFNDKEKEVINREWELFPNDNNIIFLDFVRNGMTRFSNSKKPSWRNMPKQAFEYVSKIQKDISSLSKFNEMWAYNSVETTVIRRCEIVEADDNIPPENIFKEKWKSINKYIRWMEIVRDNKDNLSNVFYILEQGVCCSGEGSPYTWADHYFFPERFKTPFDLEKECIQAYKHNHKKLLSYDRSFKISRNFLLKKVIDGYKGKEAVDLAADHTINMFCNSCDMGMFYSKSIVEYGDITFKNSNNYGGWKTFWHVIKSYKEKGCSIKQIKVIASVMTSIEKGSKRPFYDAKKEKMNETNIDGVRTWISDTVTKKGGITVKRAFWFRYDNSYVDNDTYYQPFHDIDLGWVVEHPIYGSYHRETTNYHESIKSKDALKKAIKVFKRRKDLLDDESINQVLSFKDKTIVVVFKNSKEAGNCEVGTREWIKNKKLDGRGAISIKDLIRLSNGDNSVKAVINLVAKKVLDQ